MSFCPIDPALLADYWLALLPPADEEPLEFHLLSCGDCSARLHQIQELAAAIRLVAASGALRMVVSPAFLQALTLRGARVREYTPPPGGSVQCTVTAGDDILIAHLAASLDTAAQLDLALCDAAGAEQQRLSDIPFHPAAPAVVFQESITFAKAAPTGARIARLLARDPSGAERLLGEYTFNHTRSLPD